MAFGFHQRGMNCRCEVLWFPIPCPDIYIIYGEMQSLVAFYSHTISINCCVDLGSPTGTNLTFINLCCFLVESLNNAGKEICKA